MMLVSVVSLMILAMYLGKRSKEFGIRQLAIIILIALAQVGFVLFDVYTKKMPPTF